MAKENKQKKDKEPTQQKRRISSSVNQFILKKPNGMKKVMFKYLCQEMARELKRQKLELNS